MQRPRSRNAPNMSLEQEGGQRVQTGAIKVRSVDLGFCPKSLGGLGQRNANPSRDRLHREAGAEERTVHFAAGLERLCLWEGETKGASAQGDLTSFHPT